MGSRRYGRAVAILLLATAAVAGLARGEEPTTEQLSRELEVMKQQLKQLQEHIERQETVIQKLSAEKEKKAVAAPAAAGVAATDEERIKQQVTENIMRRIQPSLAAANKTFRRSSIRRSASIIDTVGSYSGHQGAQLRVPLRRDRHLGDRRSRSRAATRSSTARNDGVEVEEAAIVTTSLPYNLTVKGGRFFADFGRLSKFHDHDLPFVNRPTVLDEYVGGESQADGVEVSYLTPLSQYVTLTGGMYNKIGAENERVEQRRAAQLLGVHLPRARRHVPAASPTRTASTSASSYAVHAERSQVETEQAALAGRRRPHLSLHAAQPGELSRPHLGNRGALQPRDPPDRRLRGHRRHGPGEPARGLGIRRSRRLPQAIDPNRQEFRRKGAVGLYSYVEPRLTRRFYPGFLFEWTKSIDPGVGEHRSRTRRTSRSGRRSSSASGCSTRTSSRRGITTTSSSCSGPSSSAATSTASATDEECDHEASV